MKFLTVVFMLILVSCEDDAKKKDETSKTVKKIEAQNKQTYTPVPSNPTQEVPEAGAEDYEIPEINLDDVVVEDTGRPINILTEGFKDRVGVFLEADLQAENMVRIEFEGERLTIGLKDNKVDCQSNLNTLSGRCLDIVSNNVRTVSGLSPGVMSIIIPIQDIGVNARHVSLINNEVVSVDTSYHQTRYHIVRSGDLNSRVLPSRVSSLVLSSEIYRDQPDLPESAEDFSGPQARLPSDFLMKREYFSMRGRYFLIEDNGWDDGGIKVFASPDLNGIPVYKITSLNYDGCRKDTDKTWFKYDEKKNKIKCDSRPDFILVDRSTTNSVDRQYFFKFKSFDLDKGYVQVGVGDDNFYLDIRHCKNSCSFQYYPFSRYETDLMNLEVVKKNKSHKELNELIDSLKPCFENNDIKCISSKFLQSSEVYAQDEEGCIDSSVSIPNYTFLKEDLEELKECLKYENLEFHQLSSRGKSKECIFAPSDTKKENVSARLLSIGPHSDLKADYRNYSYESYISVPPMTYSEVQAMKAKLK